MNYLLASHTYRLAEAAYLLFGFFLLPGANMGKSVVSENCRAMHIYQQLPPELRVHLDAATQTPSEASLGHLQAAVTAAQGQSPEIRAFLLESLGALQLAFDRIEPALDSFRQALVLSTGEAEDEARLGLATVLGLLGRTDERVELLEYFSETRHPRGRAALALVRAEHGQKDAAKLLDGLEESPELLRVRAELCLQTADTHGAEAALGKLVEFAGRAGQEARLRLGRIYLESGRYERAITHFERLLDGLIEVPAPNKGRKSPAKVSVPAKPTDGRFEALVRTELAAAWAQKGQVEVALEQLNQALELIETYGEADEPLLGIVLLRLGTLEFYGKQNLAAAEEYLEEALGVAIDTWGQEHPHTAQILVHLGHLELGRSQHKEAKALLKRALEIVPSSSEAHGALALALVAAGKMGPAKMHLERALKTVRDPTRREGLRTNLERLVNRKSSSPR